MNPQPVYVFARWQVKDGHLDTVLQLLAILSEKSNAEEGNLFYKLHQSNTDKNTLMLYECYKDEAAVSAHRNSEHFQTMVLGQIVPLLESREALLTSYLF
ncbi:hypothetical protein DYBT9275_02917 [Dyadobacter sp. CECT 9275]|uniref:ABM domain-containing protein n=1 Tax=Dyadobacter helix TaxID=2822344 RepID=A0A916NLS5_9BACT|nr:putative quinol monooxygenase [Dyadobacter sp. CECT 9275]CAG5002554.1 hypothetical protein DYBT9275_02917 [Dyadobacter sp. CECT 9275]